MKKRVKISKRSARRLARKGFKTDTRNLARPIQRGGYRM